MESQTQLKGAHLFLVAMAIALAAFIVSLDGFIVNVAIPTISGELGVPEDVGTWIVTLFTMSSTLFVPLAGWLSTRYGTVFLFGISALFFCFASFMCGQSNNFSVLLFFRVLQGAGAGLLTPLSLLLIVSTFPESKRGIAIGFWSFFVMVGPAMGPMIGGWLSDYHWKWLFHINIPFGLFSAITVMTLLWDQSEKKEKSRLDWIGMSLLFIGIGSLQIALNRGLIDDWFRSPFILTLFIVAGISLVFFIVWEIFHPNPFIEFAQFKRANFCLCVFTMGAAMALLFSSFILDSLWVQEVLGYTPAWAGYTLTPVGIFPLILYPIMGRIVSYLDLRIWVFGSFIFYAMTFFWLSTMNIEISFWQLAIPRLMQGIGFALFTIPNSLIAIHGVRHDRLIYVISLFSFVRMMFVGFGVALGVNYWTRRETFYQSRMTEQTFIGNPAFERLLAPFQSLDVTQLQTDALAYDTIVGQAWTLGLMDIYYLYGWLFLGLAGLVLLYRFPEKDQQTTSIQPI